MIEIQTIHIENGSGYIWMSDQKVPRIYKKEIIDLSLIPTANPFIIEGQLTDGNKSYSIKYADGRYYCNVYDLLNSSSYTKEAYLPHRMEEIEKLIFRRYWKEEEDPLCCNMKVLQPKELVFIGFEEKEENL